MAARPQRRTDSPAEIVTRLSACRTAGDYMSLFRFSLAVSFALLTTLGARAADTETEDSRVLQAALCPSFVGSRIVLVSTTLNTSRSQETASQQAARMGLSEEYVSTLKNL